MRQPGGRGSDAFIYCPWLGAELVAVGAASPAPPVPAPVLPAPAPLVVPSVPPPAAPPVPPVAPPLGAEGAGATVFAPPVPPVVPAGRRPQAKNHQIIIMMMIMIMIHHHHMHPAASPLPPRPAGTSSLVGMAVSKHAAAAGRLPWQRQRSTNSSPVPVWPERISFLPQACCTQAAGNTRCGQSAACGGSNACTKL